MIDAVERGFEIVGQALKDAIYKDPSITIKVNPDIPWENIVKMRDIMAHEYFEIDLFIIWETIKNDLPKLRDSLKNYLNTKN